ncbi:MAG: hypothetical protein JST00_46770 [Deltaproteobacteria bacterium]|nr:hypothetical protein [Deltaproteobacteria bacterium]
MMLSAPLYQLKNENTGTKHTATPEGLGATHSACSERQNLTVILDAVMSRIAVYQNATEPPKTFTLSLGKKFSWSAGAGFHVRQCTLSLVEPDTVESIPPPAVSTVDALAAAAWAEAEASDREFQAKSLAALDEHGEAWQFAEDD